MKTDVQYIICHLKFAAAASQFFSSYCVKMTSAEAGVLC